jgi:hypothetical protein
VRRRYLLLVVGTLSLLLYPCFAWAQDYSRCDTFYVEAYPHDTVFSGTVRVPIYVTHSKRCGEGWDPPVDSLNGFMIPLCYTHTNPSRFCSVGYDWNNIWLYPYPDYLLRRSIFRHFLGPDGDTLIHNWMMDLSQPMTGLEWDIRNLNLDDTSHFWLSMFATIGGGQYFGDASRVLLATITFQVEDTMTICIDSCFWPPSTHLAFSERPYWTLKPTIKLPCCFSLIYPALGDVNANGVTDTGDVIRLINYLYRGYPHPIPVPVGDVNCDGVVDGGDVLFLMNYLFRGGPEPSC